MARVLIVEDEAVLRSSMARALRKLTGLEVVEAGTVQEAVMSLDSAPPNLVLSDIDLPDRLGIELLGELGKRGLKVPVVFISAYLRAYGSQIPKHANVEVREKPVSLDELRALVIDKVGKTDTDAARTPFSVADFLQLACLGRHSVAITVLEDSRTVGTVQVIHGEVWSAEDERGAGEDAFLRLVSAEGPQVRTIHEPTGERTITRRWDELLLNAARVEDEARAGRGAAAAPPSAAADDGTRAAETPPDDGFDRIWDEAINALLSKDYRSAADAFGRALVVRPGDPKVEANLARLREMGVLEQES